MDTRKKNIELSDILQSYAHKLGKLNQHESKIVRDIINCRTDYFGGHKDICDDCQHIEISYNSCRNRHCPKCQFTQGNEWIKGRMRELLPVPYFHVVFTIPDNLRTIILYNKKEGYKLLFKAVSETLNELAKNPKNLGAQIGFIAVLHTWTQKLFFHPHIHCIVPGGGLAGENKDQWVACKNNYLIASKKLSLVFKGKFLHYLEMAYVEKKISVSNLNLDLKNELVKAAKKDWVVYCKKPFGGPAQVVSYLSRYTHRIAISNNRIIALKDDKVTFKYKDRNDGNKEKILTIDAVKFIRRFLLHILPYRFVKIRYFGILGNKVRAKIITLCWQLIGNQSENFKKMLQEFISAYTDALSDIIRFQKRCPKCGSTNYRTVMITNSMRLRYDTG